MISIVNTECHVPKTFSDLAKIAAWGRLGLKGTTMLQHPTLDRLNTMGLAGMAKAYGELAANAEADRLTHPEWLALLLDREWSFRHDRKLAARLRFAKLRHQASPEDVD